MKNSYVQYGCGLSAPEQWINFDVSPTLRIQKIPLFGKWIVKRTGTVFPNNVKYGDIIKGLPIKENSCSGVYSSHTLEHLSLNGFREALRNTYKILRPGGIFRCIVPDLEPAARKYIKDLDNGNTTASIGFVGGDTLLGTVARSKSLRGIFRHYLGNSKHLWMWDHESMAYELKQAGFENVRRCSFNDSSDEMFTYVEEKKRFVSAVAIECIK